MPVQLAGSLGGDEVRAGEEWCEVTDKQPEGRARAASSTRQACLVSLLHVPARGLDVFLGYH